MPHDGVLLFRGKLPFSSYQDPKSLLWGPCHSGLQAMPLPHPRQAPFASVPTFSPPHTRSNQVAVAFLKVSGRDSAWKTYTERLQGLPLSRSLRW